MRGIINNIINFYEIQTKALAVLVANTQKALEQSEKERKANEQIQRVESFVKDLNNMLTRFYFLKERKDRKQEPMTDGQVKAVTEFAIFVKTLTEKVCSLLYRFQENQTFEEKIDEEIKRLETYVKKSIKEFDEVLEDTMTGKGRTFIKRLAKRLGNVTSGVCRQRIGETWIDSGTPAFDGRGQMIEIRGEIADVPERNRAGNMELSA